MTKKSFLAKLKTKLSILEENEINDIIEEYSSHIDNKIKQGKTEKEAVLDFGDIDSLVKEILSAYKIKGSYNEDENKFENMINKFIENVIEFSKNLFNDFSEQKLSKIIITVLYIIVGLIFCGILLWFLRIPFDLIKEMGNQIINIGSNNYLTSIFKTIWNVLIELFAIILSVIVIAALIKKAIKHLSINDSKIEILNIKDNGKKTINVTKNETIKKDSVLMDFFVICLKIFIIVSVYIPLLMSDIGLAISFGIIVFFFIQGLISIGIIMMFLGSLIIAIALTILITNFLFNKGGLK